LTEKEVLGKPGFEFELGKPDYIPMVVRAHLKNGLVLPSRLHAFHEQMARELDFEDFSQYVTFCMKEVARYWLKVDNKRLGELLAKSMIEGHNIHACELGED
jgi:hypothetical protein